MQYSKPMIELVYEIRRSVPSEMKPEVKLANPELFNELIKYYYQDCRIVTRALIKELLSIAGQEWSKALIDGAPITERLQTKMYRGTVSLEKSARQSTKDPAMRTKRIYRGQVVA